MLFFDVFWGVFRVVFGVKSREMKYFEAIFRRNEAIFFDFRNLAKVL